MEESKAQSDVVVAPAASSSSTSTSTSTLMTPGTAATLRARVSPVGAVTFGNGLVSPDSARLSSNTPSTLERSGSCQTQAESTANDTTPVIPRDKS